MSWELVLTLTAGALGTTGVLAMITAFALVSRAGGWERGMIGPIRERRWPAQRAMMLTGASLVLMFGAAVGLLGAADALYWMQ